MIDPAAFREQAERCFRLAGSITDPEMVSRLRQLGRHYEEAAQRAESDSKSGRIEAGADELVCSLNNAYM